MPAGEKAGSPSFYSQIITLSPQNPVFDQVELVCGQEGFRFSTPENAIPHAENNTITVFPNPFTDFVTLSGLSEAGSYTVHIINSQGVVEKSSYLIEDIKNNTA